MKLKTIKNGALLLLLGWSFSASQSHAQSAPERVNAIYASLAGDHAGLYVPPGPLR